MVTIAYCECGYWFFLKDSRTRFVLRLKLVDIACIGVLLHFDWVDFLFSFKVVTQCLLDFRRGAKNNLRWPVSSASFRKRSLQVTTFTGFIFKLVFKKGLQF